MLDTYFTSYEDLEIHSTMLTDRPRQEAYKNAILNNSSLFQGKVVMDVGAGSGILSVFCAQAGAKKVIAVEASNLAEVCRQTIMENDFQHIVDVFQTRVEDFNLPIGIDGVDIIVSEWMGFYLLHEGMLDSVISARDRFLKPGGHMFPDSAGIYVAPCSVPSRFDDWQMVDGVKMSRFAKALRSRDSDKPTIVNVSADDLLHSGVVLTWLDLAELRLEDLEEFQLKEVMAIQKQGKYQGICIWFECRFPSSDDSQLTTLSTSPDSPPTHWKQTVVLLPDEACETLDVGDPIAVCLNMKRNEFSSRRYDLQLTLLDQQEIEHPLPCDCLMTKCILIKAHLDTVQQMEE